MASHVVARTHRQKSTRTPFLKTHPYPEWFSDRENHYRIELADGAARIASVEEEVSLQAELAAIAKRLAALPAAPAKSRTDSDWV